MVVKFSFLNLFVFTSLFGPKLLKKVSQSSVKSSEVEREAVI